MYIESLKLIINDVKIITDVDDCLFLSSKSIREHGLDKRIFWFNDDVYDKNKNDVFEKAELTAWGRDFVSLVSSGFTNYKLVTAGRDRIDILTSKLGVDGENVMQSMSDMDKIDYLNYIEEDCIYVDDKLKVIKRLTNANVHPVNYPERMQVYTKRMSNNRYRRRR